MYKQPPAADRRYRLLRSLTADHLLVSFEARPQTADRR